MGCLKQPPRVSQTLKGTCLKFLYNKTHDTTKKPGASVVVWLSCYGCVFVKLFHDAVSVGSLPAEFY